MYCMLSGPWAQMTYEFIWFHGPGPRLHMNSQGAGALGPDSMRIHILLWPWVQITYGFTWFGAPGLGIHMKSHGFGSLASDWIWILMLFWGLGSRFHRIHMVLGPCHQIPCEIMALGPWAQIPYEFKWSWSPGARFHMNSYGFGALGPDSIWSQLVLGPCAQTPYNSYGLGALGPDLIWIQSILRHEAPLRGRRPTFHMNSHVFWALLNWFT